MLFNSSFNILYTASFTNDVVAFSFESPSEISESYILKGHESTITSIALVEQTDLLLSSDENYQIKCWRLKDK